MVSGCLLETGKVISFGSVSVAIGEQVHAEEKPQTVWGFPTFLGQFITQAQESYIQRIYGVSDEQWRETLLGESEKDIHELVNNWFTPFVPFDRIGTTIYGNFEVFRLADGIIMRSLLTEKEKNQNLVRTDLPYGSYVGRFLWGKSGTGLGISEQALFLFNCYTRKCFSDPKGETLKVAVQGKIYRDRNFAGLIRRIDVAVAHANLAFQISNASSAGRGG